MSASDIRTYAEKLVKSQLRKELCSYVKDIVYANSYTVRLIEKIESSLNPDSDFHLAREQLINELMYLRAINLISNNIKDYIVNKYKLCYGIDLSDNDAFSDIEENPSIEDLLYSFAQQLVNTLAPSNIFATTLLAFSFLPVSAARNTFKTIDRIEDRLHEMASMLNLKIYNPAPILVPKELEVYIPEGFLTDDNNVKIVFYKNNKLFIATAIILYNIFGWSYFRNSILLPAHNIVLVEEGEVMRARLQTPWELLEQQYRSASGKFVFEEENSSNEKECIVYTSGSEGYVNCRVPLNSVLRVSLKPSRTHGLLVKVVGSGIGRESKEFRFDEFISYVQDCVSKAYCISFEPSRSKTRYTAESTPRNDDTILVLVSMRALIESKIRVNL